MDVIKYGKAICYSGYRKGQTPIDKIYPSRDEVYEDLKILANDFDYIRMYDSNDHCQMTLDVIKTMGINIKVLIGMDLLGEISNPNCSWGGTYTQEELAKNIAYNQNQLNQAIVLANTYSDIVIGVAAGNEAAPDWNENLVSPARILYFVKQLKKYTNTPVTYCDSAYYWTNILTDVAKVVDVISIHIYPVWHSIPLVESINTCLREYNEIKQLYPNKQIMITETGWPTKSNGGQIKEHDANEFNQLFYNNEVEKWSTNKQIICFFFEAFDEMWKGSANQNEPEKNWGFYLDNRRPKLIMKENKED